jgi:Peptide methionine sulfoxide reductase
MADSLEMTTLGGGCFWCVEAVYQELQGVQSAVSGYAGGAVENPTYYQVCNGTTGHAEVVQITFDPNIITFEDILYVFWRTHDPTTLNRQGKEPSQKNPNVIRMRPGSGPTLSSPRSVPSPRFIRRKITIKIFIATIRISPIVSRSSTPKSKSSGKSCGQSSKMPPIGKGAEGSLSPFLVDIAG